jgi:hypothetical protein
MAEKKKKGFLSRIKDSLKIKKRGLSGANKELRRKRGRNLKSNIKMASFREDTKANQKLQAEAKDPNKNYTTYTKVNKTNKAKLSDQHKVKPKVKSKTGAKSSNTGKKMSAIEKRNRDRLGDARVDKLKAKQVDFKKMRKGSMSKADFIKKYPKSITAQKAKGLRK